MATALAVAGALTLAGNPTGPSLLAGALGMTLYSIVNSAGYYVERRQAPPVVMFGVLLVLTLAALWTTLVALS